MPSQILSSAPDAPADHPMQKCGTCQKTKPLNVAEFMQMHSGYAKTCRDCSQWLADAYVKRKAAKSNKENQPPWADTRADPEDEDQQGCLDLSHLSLDMFLALVSSASCILSLEANVDIALLKGNTMWEKADKLVKCIGKELKYQFMCMPFTSS